MTRLLLVRHAESEWNASRRWQGQADPPLSPRGREEAASAAAGVSGEVEAVVTSDLIRARETGELVAEALGVGPVSVDADLREIDVGAWSGLRIDEVEARYPDELAAWRAGTAVSAPGGEHRDAFGERLRAALMRTATAHPQGRVLVVTHGGSIGRLEREVGCYPGRGPRHLEGRWFTLAGSLEPLSERISLIADSHEPAPESR